MSAYRLTISKLDDDPEYEEKVERYDQQRQRYGQASIYLNDTGISRQIETRTLSVELTPEEYTAVLRAIVTHWDQP